MTLGQISNRPAPRRQDSGFHARKGKMAPRLTRQRARQGHRTIIPHGGGGLNCGTAGHAQPHDLGGFVKGLPGGIIEGGAKAVILPR